MSLTVRGVRGQFFFYDKFTLIFWLLNIRKSEKDTKLNFISKNWEEGGYEKRSLRNAILLNPFEKLII